MCMCVHYAVYYLSASPPGIPDTYTKIYIFMPLHYSKKLEGFGLVGGSNRFTECKLKNNHKGLLFYLCIYRLMFVHLSACHIPGILPKIIPTQ